MTSDSKAERSGQNDCGSSDCFTDRIQGGEQSEKSMWQEALIDVSSCLTVETLVQAGVKQKTIYAMRHAWESPRTGL